MLEEQCYNNSTLNHKNNTPKTEKEKKIGHKFQRFTNSLTLKPRPK